MAPYIRFFHSQLYGRGQGNVDISGTTGKVAIRFFQDGSVCRFRFETEKMSDSSTNLDDISERAMRCAIAFIHSSSKQGAKCSQFEQEQELYSIRMWLGDLHVPGDGSDLTTRAWPAIAERRVDFDKAATVYAVKSTAPLLSIAKAKNALLQADVPPAVVRRVFSTRGRKRADGSSVVPD